jgi:hypothetical protein
LIFFHQGIFGHTALFVFPNDLTPKCLTIALIVRDAQLYFHLLLLDQVDFMVIFFQDKTIDKKTPDALPDAEG